MVTIIVFAPATSFIHFVYFAAQRTGVDLAFLATVQCPLWFADEIEHTTRQDRVPPQWPTQC
jgi:hypothetical protein